MSRRRLRAGLLGVASVLACGIEELGEPEPRAPATPLSVSGQFMRAQLVSP
ncbi:hypothetical protein OV079_35980 [Nannocystis pusilla]|uniref:Uncharacterized protein n=1 Tax=Nannocystis pusilla TaxID=889268 RepID=A0A9X3J1M6_9BACT|nr:hypothetical protein [Nannocystis pusilla]MCY1010874.1 hypothetical protein [Nannocystis pusilla]